MEECGLQATMFADEQEMLDLRLLQKWTPEWHCGLLSEFEKVWIQRDLLTQDELTRVRQQQGISEELLFQIRERLGEFPSNNSPELSDEATFIEWLKGWEQFRAFCGIWDYTKSSPDTTIDEIIGANRIHRKVMKGPQGQFMVKDEPTQIRNVFVLIWNLEDHFNSCVRARSFGVETIGQLFTALKAFPSGIVIRNSDEYRPFRYLVEKHGFRPNECIRDALGVQSSDVPSTFLSKLRDGFSVQDLCNDLKELLGKSVTTDDLQKLKTSDDFFALFIPRPDYKTSISSPKKKRQTNDRTGHTLSDIRWNQDGDFLGFGTVDYDSFGNVHVWNDDAGQWIQQID
jgi:hypothetical protein